MIPLSLSTPIRLLVAALLFMMLLSAAHADDGLYAEVTLTNQTRVVGLLEGEGIALNHFLFGDVAFTWEEMRTVRATNLPDEPPGAISIELKTGESLSGKTMPSFTIRTASNKLLIAWANLDTIKFPAKPNGFAVFTGKVNHVVDAFPSAGTTPKTDDPAVKPAAPNRIILSDMGFMYGGKILDGKALVSALRASRDPSDLLFIKKIPGTPGSKTADLLRVLFAAGFSNTRIE